MSSLLATFPSPSTGTLDIGPLSIHMYGITLLIAIVCAIALTGWRWTRRGGDWDLVRRRLGRRGGNRRRAAYLVTSYDQLPDEWWGPVAVWEGGLGIWGGILFGVIAGGIVVVAIRESIALFADCLAPGLLLAQAVGRWGNWWNQELFGKPTDLPWALDIDAEHCPVDYLDLATGCTENFHPIFLYEFTYNLIGVGVLLLVERLIRVRPPAVRPLHLVVHARPALRGAATHRPVARVSRPAAELLGGGRPLRRLDGVLHLVAVHPQARGPTPSVVTPGGSLPDSPAMAVPKDASARLASLPRVPGPALDLDLDTFEGPFDLLLTLILKEELRLAEVDVADIVTSFAERLEDERRLDLEACGLVPRGAMLEIKARELFPDAGSDLAELSPEEAAEELAERLEAYRRMKSAAAWLSDRLDSRPIATFVSARRRSRHSRSSASRRRIPPALPPCCASWRPSRPQCRSPTCSSRSRRSPASSSASGRCSPPPAIRVRRGAHWPFAPGAGVGLPRAPGAAQARRAPHRAAGSLRADRSPSSGRRKECCMTLEAVPLRLVDAEPLERLSRTLEALLVIASAPLHRRAGRRGRGGRSAGRSGPAPPGRARRRAQRHRAGAGGGRLRLPGGARRGRCV